MMQLELPASILIDGVEHPIRNKGDFKVVLDVINSINDPDLTETEKAQCALFIFYENISNISNFEIALREMMKFINCGEEEQNESYSPTLMDWEQDFKIIVPSINRVLGLEVRATPYLHWWTFIGAYMEIGESSFSTVISIRKKISKGKKLEKWEEEFYRENREMVDLKTKFTEEERKLLESEW